MPLPAGLTLQAPINKNYIGVSRYAYYPRGLWELQEPRGAKTKLPPQSPSGPFGTILGPFLDHFGTILGPLFDLLYSP